MATTTVSGSTVTFSNSGAAANLSKQTSEDANLAVHISMFWRQAVAERTPHYSVDNGVAGDDNPLVTTNKAFATYDTDLLYKDGAVAAWMDGGDTSALGAHVWIGTDGKIHYDATNIADQFQQLAAGETATDMVVAYALVGIVGGMITFALVWPAWVFLALASAPIGGSLLVMLVAVWLFGGEPASGVVLAQ